MSRAWRLLWPVLLSGTAFLVLLWCAHEGALKQDAWCHSQPPAQAAAAGCSR